MTTVSLGTVASVKAYSSLAPWRMIPPHSWSVPGRKPGTSVKVTIGTLKASQKRTKRAAFSDASMSSTPAICAGWLPTMPTGFPPRRAKPMTMFIAKCSCTSKKSPSSTIRPTTSRMSYGLFGASGTIESSSVSIRSCGSPLSIRGGVSRLFWGRNDMK